MSLAKVCVFPLWNDNFLIISKAAIFSRSLELLTNPKMSVEHLYREKQHN